MHKDRDKSRNQKQLDSEEVSTKRNWNVLSEVD